MLNVVVDIHISNRLVGQSVDVVARCVGLCGDVLVNPIDFCSGCLLALNLFPQRTELVFCARPACVHGRFCNSAGSPRFLRIDLGMDDRSFVLGMFSGQFFAACTKRLDLFTQRSSLCSF